MDCYTERAHLLALLSVIYPAHGYRPDDAEPGFETILCIHFPWGQASWHIADDDRRLFAHVPLTANDWDGHTTDEKYAAMQRSVVIGDVGARHG